MNIELKSWFSIALILVVI